MGMDVRRVPKAIQLGHFQISFRLSAQVLNCFLIQLEYEKHVNLAILDQFQTFGLRFELIPKH